MEDGTGPGYTLGGVRDAGGGVYDCFGRVSHWGDTYFMDFCYFGWGGDPGKPLVPWGGGEGGRCVGQKDPQGVCLFIVYLYVGNFDSYC